MCWKSAISKCAQKVTSVQVRTVSIPAQSVTSAQFKMTSARLGKPTHAPPHFWEAFSVGSLTQFQCLVWVIVALPCSVKVGHQLLPLCKRLSCASSMQKSFPTRASIAIMLTATVKTETDTDMCKTVKKKKKKIHSADPTKWSWLEHYIRCKSVTADIFSHALAAGSNHTSNDSTSALLSLQTLWSSKPNIPTNPLLC